MKTAKAPVSATLQLGLLLLAGLVLRLIFIGDEGFKNDISSFEAWAITLAAHPLSQFYGSTQFVDYPTGYFYVLAFIGHVFTAVSPHNDYNVLRLLVKLPAILMDLVDAALLYAIVRRYASDRWALGAAALFVLNPAIIFISASWGQVDSVAAGFALLGVYALLRSEDQPAARFPYSIVLGWLSMAYSLLIKPQAAVLLPLFIAFAFVSNERRPQRVVATAAGILGAIALAYLLTVPFHPNPNPGNVLAWLYGQYQHGKDIYAVNSVNAFNLWAVMHAFWQPDSQQVAIWPQYLWGIVLTAVAVALVLVRYVQAPSTPAFIEAAALSTLAFFMLSTRMHERYLFNGLLFTIAAIPLARRYLWAAGIFSATLFVNLFYSLKYLTVVTQSVPGVNAADMWPFVTHPLAALNVLTFFYLGYVFLGQSAELPEGAPSTGSGLRRFAPPAVTAVWWRARSWFDPGEGLAKMVWPLDYALAAIFGVVSFIVSYVNYWNPKEKIFDEIYFARAAEEYLSHKYIYENTHPPLTKLIITLSTMLFGGDNSHGWRFLDVVFGAIAVVLIYVFAKRLTRSALFSSFAAVLLVADGMHFVQSRIATPEGIVVVFALGTLYAFYRYWIASQSTVRPYEPHTIRRAAYSALAALVAGYILSAVVTVPFHQSRAAFVVTGLYLASGLYLLFRLVVVPKFMKAEGEFASYAEGSRLIKRAGASELETPDGRIVRGKGFQIEDEDLTVTYGRDLSARYATPAATATYTPGLVHDDRGETQEGRHATGWLIAFTILLGALVASKWYGVMAYGVSFVVIAVVWLERYWRNGKLMRWGNPFGFRLDVSIAAIVFLSMTVYALVWVPDLIRQIEIKNLTDLMYRQYSMYEYHETLNLGGRNQHPYASPFWSWPIDLRPIAYYWKDFRIGAAAVDSHACCVAEIISLPNPLIMWFGLLTVPWIGFLAWRERNKGFALLVIAYLLQWLPWARSPRITFIYHFYVDIPIIILCSVLVLQRIWNWGEASPETKWLGRAFVCAYVGLVVAAFIWFYPILAGVPIPWDQWNARMWLQRWVI